MKKSENITNLAKALVAFQASVQPVAKEKVNPFFHSKYADLSAIWEAVRALLSTHGLAVIQTNSSSEEGTTIVETMLIHTSGEWVLGEMTVPLVKRDPQGVGSAITYGRRYGLSAMLGIVADEDDDGNSHAKKPTTLKETVTQRDTKKDPKEDALSELQTITTAKDIDFKQFILDEFPKAKTSGDLTSAQIQLLIAKARKA